MAKSKKSKVLASVAAVALAASLLVGGGTYAYLQGETNDVVNNFDTNKVTVALAETTGNDYDIVPGTSQPKDPKVTVDATVDAYVYVEVKDGTEGLVSYTMADGWTLLDGYENVYYREVSASDAEQSFDVLAGNEVTYDAALENSDMVDAEGNLKEGVDLTFKAYAIQKAGFADAVAAYIGKDSTPVSSEESLVSAFANGGNVIVNNDVAVEPEGTGTALIPQSRITKDTTINLNGNTISVDAPASESLTYTPVIMSIDNGTTVINGDGTITAEAGENNSYGITVYGGSLVINGGNYYGALTAIQVEKGSLVINGGFFDLAPTCKAQVPEYANYVVNVIDSAYKNGTATIEITGGTFVNFDPSANPEGAGTSYVADGYTVKSEEQSNGDVWYTVVAE